MTDPLLNTLIRSTTGEISSSDPVRMRQLCASSVWEGYFRAYGNDLIIAAYSVTPRKVLGGLEARAILVRRIIDLGTDIGPAFLEIAHKGRLGHEDALKALKPGAMIRTILKGYPRDPSVYISVNNLDEFLFAIPIPTIKRNAKHPDALARRFQIGGEPELLEFASSREKGEILENDLGL